MIFWWILTLKKTYDEDDGQQSRYTSEKEKKRKRQIDIELRRLERQGENTRNAGGKRETV